MRDGIHYFYIPEWISCLRGVGGMVIVRNLNLKKLHWDPPADPGGPQGFPFAPKVFFSKSCSFQATFGKTAILSTLFWAQGPPLGSKLHWAPWPKSWICPWDHCSLSASDEGDERDMFWAVFCPKPFRIHSLYSAFCIHSKDFVRVWRTKWDREFQEGMVPSSPLLKMHLWAGKPPVSFHGFSWLKGHFGVWDLGTYSQITPETDHCPQTVIRAESTTLFSKNIWKCQKLSLWLRIDFQRLPTSTTSWTPTFVGRWYSNVRFQCSRIQGLDQQRLSEDKWISAV